jgi:hypothetical protein
LDQFSLPTLITFKVVRKIVFWKNKTSLSQKLIHQ